MYYILFALNNNKYVLFMIKTNRNAFILKGSINMQRYVLNIHVICLDIST